VRHLKLIFIDDVNTIKGWMTLEQTTSVYDVPLVEILTQCDLPTDTPTQAALKDLESGVFSVTSLREWQLSRISDRSAKETTGIEQPAPASTLEPEAPAATPTVSPPRQS
jgi:hypothetical protein